MPATARPEPDKPPFRILSGAEALARLRRAESLTPFQQAAFLEAFLNKTGRTERFRVVVIGLEGASLLLPLEISGRGPFRIADIVGGKQASFHAGASEGRPALTAETLRAALLGAGRAMGIDAFTFSDCPIRYAGDDNPLASLPHQPSPSSGWALTLEPDSAALLDRLSDREYRKKLRYKVRKLEAFGELHAEWASTSGARAQAFEALFRWKAQRFGAAGIEDPFADPAMREFLTSASDGPEPVIRLFTLSAGDRLVAVMAGASTGRIFSGMLNGHENEADIARNSPGEQLLVHLIRQLSAEGYAQFDLGVGEARYKAHYCPEEIALFDAALGVNARGMIAARLYLAARAMKRTIKQNPRWMGLVSRLRRLKAR